MGDAVKDKTMMEEPDTDKPSPRAKKSSNVKQIILGIIILLCGFLIGSGMTILIARRMVVNAIKHPEGIPQRITNRIKRNLDLSDAQAETVQQIISRHLRDLYQIRRETQPRVRQNLEQLKEEVADVLNKKQEQKWRERFESLERLFPPDPTSPEPENP
jgi:hypothetical protein